MPQLAQPTCTTLLLGAPIPSIHAIQTAEVQSRKRAHTDQYTTPAFQCYVLRHLHNSMANRHQPHNAAPAETVYNHPGKRARWYKPMADATQAKITQSLTRSGTTMAHGACTCRWHKKHTLFTSTHTCTHQAWCPPYAGVT